MMSTTFWHPDGTPMTAQQFIQLLFGEKLPAFFQGEAALRAIWAVPGTRLKLLQGLKEKGIGPEQLAVAQKIIDAQDAAANATDRALRRRGTGGRITTL